MTQDDMTDPAPIGVDSSETQIDDFTSEGGKAKTRIARELFGDVVQFADFILIIVCAIAVAHIYHDFYLNGPYEFQRYATAGIIGATGFTALSRRDGFYEFENLLSTTGSIRSMVTQWAMVIFGLLAFGFALKVSDAFSRAWLFGWVGTSLIGLVLSRLIAAMSLKKTTRHDGVFSRRIAVVGANDLGVSFADKATHSGDPVTIVGIYDIDDADTGKIKGLYQGGNLDDLVRAARSDEIDDIIIASDELQSDSLRRLVRRLSTLPVSIALCPSANWMSHEGGELGFFAGSPILNLYRRPLEGWGGIIKMLEDRILGLILLILASPILVLVTIAVKLQGKGPILFAQQRHGFNHEVFKIYKFRSMTVAEDGDKVVQAQKGDARITPIGAFLRRYSLDELPQLINVVKGNMSLVGPRPHALAHNHQYARTVENYSGRHKVKPGITGWAQVNGYRGETSENEMMEDRVKYDLEYIDNWSIIFDAKILVMTVMAVLFPKNAH